MPGEFRGGQFGGLRRCFALEFVAAIRLDCCTTRRLLRYALGPDQQRAVQPLGSQRLLNRAAAGTHRFNRLLLHHRHWPARHGLIGLHLQNLGGARRRQQRAHSRAANLRLDAGGLGRDRRVGETPPSRIAAQRQRSDLKKLRSPRVAPGAGRAAGWARVASKADAK